MSERKPETYAVIGAMDAAINDLTSAKSTAVETIARLVDRIKELQAELNHYRRIYGTDRVSLEGEQE